MMRVLIGVVAWAVTIGGVVAAAQLTPFPFPVAAAVLTAITGYVISVRIRGRRHIAELQRRAGKPANTRRERRLALRRQVRG